MKEKLWNILLGPVFVLVFATPLIPASSFAQQQSSDSIISAERIVIPGMQYQRSPSFQKWWGKHYREEWTTPAKFPVLMLDTAFGGLKPYQAGGGRQSKTLRLKDAQGNEYVLRSIDKSFGKALPEIYQNSFIQRIIDDQVSIAHPYSALTIPSMAEAAGIYHTNPVIRYLPWQPALDSFNKAFSEDLYLLEQRPDGNWEVADNFGNSKDIISTEKLFELLLKDQKVTIDQAMYVRARLFDIFIGDWGRHEDQWRWALKEDNGRSIYQPIPRDRDQAFTKFDGKLLGFVLSFAGLSHLQTFESKIADVNTFNFPARYLDRRMANATTLALWVNTAKELQASLTDAVIEEAVRQLPPEVYPISGPDMTAKLKSRRSQLPSVAEQYYKFISKEVDIVGSKEKEVFLVEKLDEKETRVSVFATNKNQVDSTPLYSRIFNSDETEEIRIYGIDGTDQFLVKGGGRSDTRVRLIGGPASDKFRDESTGKQRVDIYDDHVNDISKGAATKLHLSNDTTVHQYRYDAFKYDKKGLSPILFYNNPDRFYVGLNYRTTNQKWRKEPFSSQHSFYANYSISQNALSFGYGGAIIGFIGKWDLLLNADYDFVRWVNFFGRGNETQQETDDRQYYRVRTREAMVGVGLNRNFGKGGNLRVTPFYQMVKVLHDEDRYLDKIYQEDDTPYEQNHFGGIGLLYTLSRLADPVMPRRGYFLTATLSHTQNLQHDDRYVTRYSGGLNFFVPLGSRFVFASKSGASTLTGKPEFYQLNFIGGSQNLRGYRRERFRANTAFFTNNELQYIFDFRTGSVNGRAGLFIFHDIGRVWEPGEESETWHNGMGGGLMVAPFNRFMVSVSYGVSREDGMLHIRFSRAL